MNTTAGSGSSRSADEASSNSSVTPSSPIKSSRRAFLTGAFALGAAVITSASRLKEQVAGASGRSDVSVFNADVLRFDSAADWSKTGYRPNLSYFWGELNESVTPAYDPYRAVASRTRLFVLHERAFWVRNSIEANGGSGVYMQYVRAEAIMDDLGDDIWRNQVADLPGAFQSISLNHPDWFLLDTNGRRIHPDVNDRNEDHFWMMDPGSQGWREFFVSQIRLQQALGRLDGLWLDNIELSLAKRENSGQRLAKYGTDWEYREAVKGFVSYVRKEFADKEGKELGANLIAQRYQWDASWADIGRYMNGVTKENWLLGWETEKYSKATWEHDMIQAEQAILSGQRYMAVVQGQLGDVDRMRFAFFSYLLVMDAKSTFRYTNMNHYDEYWHYDEYDIDLGEPLNKRYQDNGFWVRDFSRGRVRVSPDTMTAFIEWW